MFENIFFNSCILQSSTPIHTPLKIFWTNININILDIFIYRSLRSYNLCKTSTLNPNHNRIYFNSCAHQSSKPIHTSHLEMCWTNIITFFFRLVSLFTVILQSSFMKILVFQLYIVCYSLFFKLMLNTLIICRTSRLRPNFLLPLHSIPVDFLCYSHSRRICNFE